MNQKKLFVGNLSFKIKSLNLKELFEEFGTVEDAVVITDRDSGRSKGFGFVTFEDSNNAKDAVAKMDGKTVEGRPIRVNIAKEKEARTGGGHGAGARGGRSNYRDNNRDRDDSYNDER